MPSQVLSNAAIACKLVHEAILFSLASEEYWRSAVPS